MQGKKTGYHSYILEVFEKLTDMLSEGQPEFKDAWRDMVSEDERQSLEIMTAEKAIIDTPCSKHWAYAET